jgi:DNA-binding GntR family transcriptional regulator
MVDTAPPIVPLAIERLTTAERVAEALREQLLSGRYRPGTALRDAELSARAGVSRTTVREALALLAREGLLTHSLHRGMEVTRLSPDEVRDIYATRRLIERAGLETLLVEPAAAIEPLDLALRDMAAAARQEDMRRLVEADLAFHTALGSALQSRRLLTAHGGALRELRLALSVTDRVFGDPHDQLRQHQELFRLIRDRRPEAPARLDEHLARAEALVCAALRSRADSG